MPVYEEKNKNKWTKDGRKYYFKTQYTDMYGKRKAKKSRMYKSRAAAKRSEDEFLANVATTDETDLDVSFENVYKEWLVIKKRTLKSLPSYVLECQLNKNILNYFKKFKLHNIKMDTINKWYDWLENESNIKSTDYKNKIIGYLKEILSYSRDNFEFDGKIVSKISKNKCEDVISLVNDAEINCWTLEEFNIFIKSVDDELYNTIFNFLFFTGLRKGEMFALNWNDIDFENKSIKINKTLNNKSGTGTYQITSPKTKNSNRIIDLDDKIIELLKTHYEKESKIYGFNKTMFMFGNIKPISGTSLARDLDYYIDISKVKRITPHGFRHSHATMLINLGCSLRDVADRLGDTIEVVEKTYYHVLPKQRSNTINVLNNLKNRG